MVAVSRYLASWLAIVPFVAAIDTYDVVIVGSGPGGLIAAEYLSRDPSVSVLVLEAGGPSLQASGGTDVPGYAASRGWTKFDIPGEYTGAASIFAPENAKYTIDYTDDRKLQLAQMVGGCSSVNAALYFRVPESYLTIAHWPFDANHVSAMFDELERDVYGVTDTPSTDARRYNQEAYNIVSQALKSAGFQENSLNTWDAVNHKDKTFGHAPFVIKDGLRDSPAKTCWGKMKSRSNVKLLTYAKVNYIKHNKGKANGVVYNNNQEVAVSARGAVIMGAGAIGTPKVLIQSGIGPSWQLKGLKGKSAFPGITNTYGNNGDGWVVNELVGQNLFDTTLALASFSHHQMNAFHVDKKSTDDINNYMNSRKGPLASPGPVLIAYESFVVQDREYDFQLTVLNEGLLDSRTNDRAFGAALYINNPESRDSCSFDIGTGKYRAFTANTLYMDSSRDLAAMAEFASRVASKLEGVGATFLRNKQQSIKDWAFANRQYVTNHFGGTCYASSESKRCADDKLRVVGTSNIYIADASAMKDGTVNPYGFIMYIGREAGNVVKAALANGPTTPPTVSPPTQCTLTEKDVDYTGNDIGNAPSSKADGCCAICAAKSGCGAFSWSNYNGGTCYLKSGKGAWTTKSGVTSGVVGKATSQCSPVEANVDYSGADIGSASSGKVDGCCQLCLNKSGCNAYSWNNYNGGTCYFKSGKGNTSNKAGVYSGTVTRSNRRKHKKAEDIDIDVTEEDDEDDLEERHAKHHKATNGTVHVHIRLHKSKKKN